MKRFLLALLLGLTLMGSVLSFGAMADDTSLPPTPPTSGGGTGGGH